MTDPRDIDTLTHAVPLDEEQTGLPETVEVPDDEDEGEDDPETDPLADFGGNPDVPEDDAPGNDA